MTATGATSSHEVARTRPDVRTSAVMPVARVASEAPAMSSWGQMRCRVDAGPKPDGSAMTVASSAAAATPIQREVRVPRIRPDRFPISSPTANSSPAARMMPSCAGNFTNGENELGRSQLASTVAAPSSDSATAAT